MTASMYGARLSILSIATLVMMTGAFAMAGFYAPMDASEGISQKIFYLHVPLAIVALAGFIWGGIAAAMFLRTGDRRWDLRSYCVLHHALIFAVGVLASGAIWARSSWGAWWVWEEPTLVSFLIITLLYVTYSPLRFALEDPDKQARYASVFAVVAGVFVPLNFMAVRMASSLIHPRTLDSTSNLPPRMGVAFLLCLVAIALLYVTLVEYEMTQKSATFQLRRLRRRLGDDPGRPRSAAPDLSETNL